MAKTKHECYQQESMTALKVSHATMTQQIKDVKESTSRIESKLDDVIKNYATKKEVDSVRMIVYSVIGALLLGGLGFTVWFFQELIKKGL